MPFPGGGPAPGPVKTSALKSKILNIATPNNYLVRLQPPSLVAAVLDRKGVSYATNGSDIELRCHRTSMPGTSFLTHSVSSDVQGQVEEIPYRRGYNTEITMGFIVDTDYKVLQFFETWQDYMSGIETNGSDNTASYYEVGATYRPNYYDDYITSIFITKFEKDTGTFVKSNRLVKPEMEVTLLKAYPKLIADVELMYGPTGEFLNVDVTFGYSRYVKRRKNGGTTGGTTPPSDTDKSVPNVPPPIEGQIGDFYTGPGDPTLPSQPSEVFNPPFTA